MLKRDIGAYDYPKGQQQDQPLFILLNGQRIETTNDLLLYPQTSASLNRLQGRFSLQNGSVNTETHSLSMCRKKIVKCSTQSGTNLSIHTHGDLQRRGGSKIVRAKGGQQHQGNLQVKQGSCTYQLGDCDCIYKTCTSQRQPPNRGEEGGMKSHPSSRSYCHLITDRSISFH